MDLVVDDELCYRFCYYAHTPPTHTLSRPILGRSWFWMLQRRAQLQSAVSILYHAVEFWPLLARRVDACVLFYTADGCTIRVLPYPRIHFKSASREREQCRGTYVTINLTHRSTSIRKPIEVVETAEAVYAAQDLAVVLREMLLDGGGTLLGNTPRTVQAVRLFWGYATFTDELNYELDGNGETVVELG